MDATTITANAVPLVQFYRQAHPTTPIIFAEGTQFGRNWASPDAAADQAASNAALHAAYATLQAGGDANLHYVTTGSLFSAAGLLDTPCANGLHPTDSGMFEVAAFWTAYLPTVWAA
jgi:hypothetical protein